MASPTWWTWVWALSVSWWWTGKPSMLQTMRSQMVRHDLAKQLNRTDCHTQHTRAMIESQISREVKCSLLPSNNLWTTVLWMLQTFFFKNLFIYFTLQYCIGFAIHWHESAMGVHVFPILNPPPTSLPIRSHHPSASAPSTLYHASNLDWWFLAHMIIYMFQYHSPISSRPHPLPQSPKDCSIHLCLLLSHIQGYHYHLSKFHIHAFSSLQSLSHVWYFASPRIAARQASLSITNSWSLLKFMSIESKMPSSHLIRCHSLLLLPQSLPASGSFPVSQLFTWGGQSIGVSATASVLPMNTQDWSPLGWTAWLFLQSKELSRVFSNTTVQKHQIFGTQLSSHLSTCESPTLTSIHDHWKNHNLD